MKMNIYLLTIKLVTNSDRDQRSTEMIRIIDRVSKRSYFFFFFFDIIFVKKYYNFFVPFSPACCLFVVIIIMFI